MTLYEQRHAIGGARCLSLGALQQTDCSMNMDARDEKSVVRGGGGFSRSPELSWQWNNVVVLTPCDTDIGGEKELPVRLDRSISEIVAVNFGQALH